MSMAAPLAMARQAGAGSPVVFLHGLGSDRLSWAAVEPAASGHAIWNVDLPGHGESDDDPGDGSIDTLVERVFTDPAIPQTGPLHLVGHSLGGGLALAYAASRPDRVASLFLIAPAGLGRGLDRSFLEGLPEIASDEDAAELLRRGVSAPHLISPPIVARALSRRASPSARGALRAMAHWLLDAEGRLSADADAVSARGLRRFCVWGAEDRINPPDPARLDGFGPHRLIEGAGHLPQVEAPMKVRKLLVEHLTAGAEP